MLSNEVSGKEVQFDFQYTEGERVRYYFPNPASDNHFFEGNIEYISNSQIIIRSENNVRLKISRINFENIEKP